MRHVLPPILVTLLLAIAVPLGLFVPILGPLPWAVRIIGVVIAGIGLALTAANATRFAQVGTNIKTFDDPDLLVTSGAFRFTRNPMYLGFLLVLTGVAILVGSLSAWIGPTGFWIAGQYWYIPFEEQRMHATFGTEYADYSSRVRRWVGTR